jgi:HEAT repeat protein
VKRFILLFVLVVVVVLLGVAGYFGVKWAMDRGPLMPMSIAELEKLEAQGEAAAPEIPRILACFDRSNEDLRIQAALTLKAIGPKAVGPVAERLEDRDAKVRFCAAETLAWIGPAAEPATEKLVAHLQDENADVRYKSAYALGKIGARSDSAILALIKALGDKEKSVVETSQETLKQMGSPPPEAIPALVKLTKDQNQAIRELALTLLGRAGPPAVPAFKDLLKDADTLNTIELIKAIAPLGAAAKPLLPELESIMVKNKWWDAQDDQLMLFKKCGEDGAKSLTNILTSLHDPKSPHFDVADDRSVILLKAIGEMGADSKSAVPVLLGLLKDRPTLRPRVLETLGDIGPSAREQARAEVEALVSNPALAAAARTALRRMGVAPEEKEK